MIRMLVGEGLGTDACEGLGTTSDFHHHEKPGLVYGTNKN